jgi:2-keto-4-pentenoate hydratase
VNARVDQGQQPRYSREGTGANVLGDPRIALTWLANQLSSLGITLEKGQVVTTGTCMVPLEIEPGDAVDADFGVLGRVLMRFSA